MTRRTEVIGPTEGEWPQKRLEVDGPSALVVSLPTTGTKHAWLRIPLHLKLAETLHEEAPYRLQAAADLLFDFQQTARGRAQPGTALLGHAPDGLRQMVHERFRLCH
jgi:hypothetical protein